MPVMPGTTVLVLVEHLTHVPRGVLTLVGARTTSPIPPAILMVPWSIPSRSCTAGPGNSLESTGENQDSGPLDQALQPGLRLLQGSRRRRPGYPRRASSRISGSMLVTTPMASRTRMPVGVGAQRHRKVFAQFGELGDLVDLGGHLLAGLAQEQAADDDVLNRRSRVHPHAKVENRCDAAPYGRRAAGGLVDAGQQPQQRRFPAPLCPTRPTLVAHPQLQ